jgi:hypothetical protein
MKWYSLCILLLLGVIARTQPTGSQRIYFQIYDVQKADTFYFMPTWKKNPRKKSILKYKNYEVRDLSRYPTGFIQWPHDLYFYKTLMEKNHHIQIIRKRKDTMNILLVNVYDRCFLPIPFQKGNFIIYLPPYAEKNNYAQMLPKFPFNAQHDSIKNISPIEWTRHREIPGVSFSDYKYNLVEQYMNPETYAKYTPTVRTASDTPSISKPVVSTHKEVKKEVIEPLISTPVPNNPVRPIYRNRDTLTHSGYSFIVQKLSNTYLLPEEADYPIYKILVYYQNAKIPYIEFPLTNNPSLDILEVSKHLEVQHINFDSIPDLKVTFSNKEIGYFLSTYFDEQLQFYREYHLNRNKQWTRDTTTKEIVLNENTDYTKIKYTLRGIYLDTLIKFEQIRQRPMYAVELYFTNVLGRLTNFPHPNPDSVKPIAAKETGDYNFDGVEDYRIEETMEPREWNYFLWNRSKKIFERDSLLSKLSYSHFNFEKKEFTGSLYTRIDSETSQYDTYSYINKKFVVAARSVCVQISPSSEASVCTRYLLKDGKLVEVEVIHTPE